MLKLACLTFGAALLGVVPTAASAQHVNLPDAPCRAPQAGAALTDCLGGAEKAADAALNETYSKTMGVLEAGDRDRLQTSERAWLTYRDTFCDGEYGLYGGGSGGPAARLACMEALTRAHEADLKAAYGWHVEKVSGSAMATQGDIDRIIAKLDITTFPNSIGPRREPTKHTFADYGFTRIAKKPGGAFLSETDGGWQMSFDIIAVTPDAIDVCFHDQGLTRPGDAHGPSYNATSALRIARAAQELWSARKIKGGFPGCVNDPPSP